MVDYLVAMSDLPPKGKPLVRLELMASGTGQLKFFYRK